MSQIKALSDQERRQLIQYHTDAIKGHRGERQALLQGCGHDFTVHGYGLAICNKCGWKVFRWSCDINTGGSCEFEVTQKEISTCVHCGRTSQEADATIAQQIIKEKNE